jgi:hypothetical protein
MQELLEMALRGGPTLDRGATLGLDSPIVAAASTFLPGATGLDVSGPVSTAVGAPSTSLGYAANKTTAATQGLGSRVLTPLNNLRKGYEQGVAPLVSNQTRALQGMIPQGPTRAGMPAINRMAGAALKNPLLQKGLAYAPAIGTALAVGDVVLGDESLANKAMDATAMGIGGFLGSAVPVVGTGLGIAAGKMTSDATQWLFGDKKTPEQRKMELALAQMQAGGIY